MLRTRKEVQLLVTTWVPRHTVLIADRYKMPWNYIHIKRQASDEDSSGQGLRQGWEETEIFWNELVELAQDLEGT